MQETRHILDVRKASIQADITSLFGEVREVLAWAMGCLASRDQAECARLVEHDAQLNAKRRAIEHQCLATIASQQPVAHDLRDLIADMRIASELERMGDYASDISASVMELDAADLGRAGLEQVKAMFGMCQQMLGDVLASYRGADAGLARQAAAMDDALDERLRHMIAEVMAAMRADPAMVDNGSRMLWIAHNLERCGDRATNIAEQVVFRVEGEEVDLD